MKRFCQCLTHTSACYRPCKRRKYVTMSVEKYVTTLQRKNKRVGSSAINTNNKDCYNIDTGEK